MIIGKLTPFLNLFFLSWFVQSEMEVQVQTLVDSQEKAKKYQRAYVVCPFYSPSHSL